MQGEVNAFERSALSKSGCFYQLCRSFLTNPVQKHPLCLSHRSLERGVILFRRQSAWEGNAFERSALSKSGCFYNLLRSFLTNPVQKHSLCLSHRNLEYGVILFRRQSAGEGNAFERSALSKSGCFYQLCRSFLTNPVQKHPLCLSHRNLERGVILFRRQSAGEGNAFERSALSKSGCFYHLCRSFLTNPVQKHPLCLSHRNLERGVILFRRQSAGGSKCI